MQIFAAALVSFFGLCSALSARQATPFYDPRVDGGSMLDDAGNGFGEPLNVIISGASSPDVLTDSGFLNYAQAMGFSNECFGIHLGDSQFANLGDGNGWISQTMELREDYGNPNSGSCLESAIGGNHLRMWRQNGAWANSGALFLTVSLEKSVLERHHIASNGYNAGRDDLVAKAVGQITYDGVSYSTSVDKVTDLLLPGAEGVNHGISQDGIVALLTVIIN